eukprot:TRINITY_DN3075_c0_g1_i4.p2 TRINITY_DN3075_c0_g1~~TRINITY_DN3075_c0_g1_i4.p2  ORF type:complete len:208 (-),score=39.98 TRINITY_DN3075_c0_g1_i4:160-783(-)
MRVLSRPFFQINEGVTQRRTNDLHSNSVWNNTLTVHNESDSNSHQTLNQGRQLNSVSMISPTTSSHECIDVLLVDDNDFNLTSLQKMLGRFFQLKCHNAYNGEQAIEKIKKKLKESANCEECKNKPYKLVFMDCDMPIMDGLEATKLLREKMKDGELPELRIIACTAFAFPSEIEKCYAAGMDDYLTKPVNSGTLKEKIGKWLGSQV